MKNTIFTGSGVALVTPFDRALQVDYNRLEQLVAFQIQEGTDAIIACGTTSEASTMTEAEHKDVISFIIEKVKGRIPVIAGTGSNDTKFCLELSLEAKNLGADGLLLVTPYYNKTSQAGLVAHFNYVADHVKLPCIVYNVPSRTALNILPETYLELSKNPYIVATKEANGNISALAHTMALCGDNLDIYTGEDDLTLPVMAMGGKGVISVFANALPGIMHQLTAALLQEDLPTARAIATEYQDLMRGFFMDVNPVPVKEAMNMMGILCGDCRMPLVGMSEENRRKMRTLLQKHQLIASN